MPLNAPRIQQLLEGYVARTLSSEEEQELFAAIAEDEVWFRQVAEGLALPFTDGPIALIDDERQEILNAIFASSRSASVTRQIPVHRIHFLKTAWFRYAAAILIVLGLAYLYWNTKQEKPTPVLVQKIPAKTDVLPGGNKAILTLANGSTIVLDSAANGALARQGYTQINKTANGAIAYVTDRAGAQMTEVSAAMNTMTTPKGGQYQLTLPDGTKVWLNAASSITYPTVFAGKTREVQISGEAYLEVARNTAQPFQVKFPAKTAREGENGRWMTIVVLGTSFNVNQYADDASAEVQTTLLDGSIRINASGQSKVLQPRQQAATSFGKADIRVQDNVNVEQVMAWKNGLFSFDKLTMEQAMMQVERWYDVTVVYDQSVPRNQLFGEVDRQLTLNQLLVGLEGVAAHFHLEGKVLHVRPL